LECGSCVFDGYGFVLIDRNCCESCKKGKSFIVTLGEAVNLAEIEIIGNIYEEKN